MRCDFPLSFGNCVPFWEFQGSFKGVSREFHKTPIHVLRRACVARCPAQSSCAGPAQVLRDDQDGDPRHDRIAAAAASPRRGPFRTIRLAAAAASPRMGTRAAAAPSDCRRAALRGRRLDSASPPLRGRRLSAVGPRPTPPRPSPRRLSVVPASRRTAARVSADAPGGAPPSHSTAGLKEK